MANEFVRAQSSEYNTPSPTQLELLEVLLAPDESPYPWNTTAPESEAYFREAERNFAQGDWIDEEIAARAPIFFTSLEQLWHTTTPIPVPSLQTALQERFASVPHVWLDAIADAAKRVFSTQMSTAEKLVACVQVLLPHLAEEDLQVLARPFAYSMRGSVPELPSDVRWDWTTLSEIEQARVAIAIADYALAQLRTE